VNISPTVSTNFVSITVTKITISSVATFNQSPDLKNHKSVSVNSSALCNFQFTSSISMVMKDEKGTTFYKYVYHDCTVND
jgi:hypothetical protein